MTTHWNQGVNQHYELRQVVRREDHENGAYTMDGQTAWVDEYLECGHVQPNYRFRIGPTRRRCLECPKPREDDSDG